MSDYRKLTQRELVAEATERFGRDGLDWKFRCPRCGDEATAQDFIVAGAEPERVGQQCIGRSLGALTKPKATNTRGCDWTASGLICGPWEVVVPAEDDRPERSIWAFPLAEVSA